MTVFRALIWLTWYTLPYNSNCMHSLYQRTSAIKSKLKKHLSTIGSSQDPEAYIAIHQMILSQRDQKPNGFTVKAIRRKYQKSLCRVLGKCTQTKLELGCETFADDPNAPCLCKRHGKFDTKDFFLILEE